jgi:hypothetical protein
MPDEPTGDSSRLSAIGLALRLMFVVALALISSVIISAGIREGLGGFATVTRLIAGLLRTDRWIAVQLTAAADMFVGSNVALGTAGIAVAAIMATWKDCMTAVEGLLSAYPVVRVGQLRTVSLRLFVTLVMFFVGVLATRTAASPSSPQPGLELSFPSFLLPIDPAPNRGLMTAFVPFEHDANQDSLVGTTADTSINVPEPYQKFLVSLSVALASCRSSTSGPATPLKVEVAGFATGTKYSSGKGKSLRDLLEERPEGKVTASDKLEALRQLAVGLTSVEALDKAFDMFAANERRNSVRACLLGAPACSTGLPKPLAEAAKLTSDEIDLKQWTWDEMRQESMNDLAASGLTDMTVRGFLTRYARVSVIRAGRCERSVLANVVANRVD